MLSAHPDKALLLSFFSPIYSIAHLHRPHHMQCTRTFPVDLPLQPLHRSFCVGALADHHYPPIEADETFTTFTSLNQSPDDIKYYYIRPSSTTSALVSANRQHAESPRRRPRLRHCLTSLSPGHFRYLSTSHTSTTSRIALRISVNHIPMSICRPARPPLPYHLYIASTGHMQHCTTHQVVSHKGRLSPAGPI